MGLAWSWALGRQGDRVRRKPRHRAGPTVCSPMPLLRTGASPCRASPGGGWRPWWRGPARALGRAWIWCFSKPDGYNKRRSGQPLSRALLAARPILVLAALGVPTPGNLDPNACIGATGLWNGFVGGVFDVWAKGQKNRSLRLDGSSGMIEWFVTGSIQEPPLAAGCCPCPRLPGRCSAVGLSPAR